jgi:hypothetical protein
MRGKGRGKGKEVGTSFCGYRFLSTCHFGESILLILSFCKFGTSRPGLVPLSNTSSLVVELDAL